MLERLFSEESPISMMRILSLIGTITGVALAFVGVIMNRDLMGLSTLVGVFVGASFAGKVVQKIHEVKEAVDGNKE
jgi:hypothetical protein